MIAVHKRSDGTSTPSTPADIHRDLVEQFSTPTVLVTKDGDIVHVSARASRYLRYAAGEPSHAIVQAVPADLRQALRIALAQANQIDDRVDAETVRTTMDGQPVQVQMVVQPAHHPAWPDGDAAGVVRRVEGRCRRRSGKARPRTRRSPSSRKSCSGATNRCARRSSSTKHPTEELKASNEELQAINEELRSATEELETSKEELQSINEELITVNQELKSKVEQTSEIVDDLNNFIAASNIATVFVDPQMRIKRFTPAAAQIFNLIESDVGRSLLDITHRLDYPDLAEDASAVFAKLMTIEREIGIDDGRRLLARLLPYRTIENRISGAVLNFIDVTNLRQAESQVDVDRERSQLVAETMTDFAILTLDPGGRMTSWNPGAANVFGYDAEEAIGQPFEILFTEADQAAGIPANELKVALQRGRAPDERWMRRKDGSIFFASGVSAPLRAGGAQGFAKICRDMTGCAASKSCTSRHLMSAQMGEALAVAESEKKNEFLAVMSHELKHPLNLISVNAQLLATLPEVQSVPAAMRVAQTIQRTVMSQGRIIDDLLDMSRLNTGKLTVNRVPSAAWRNHPAGRELGHRRGARSARADPCRGPRRAAHGRRRCHPHRADCLEPAEQRDQVQPDGRNDPGAPRAAGRRGGAVRQRQRPRHRPGVPAPCLRALQAGRLHHPAQRGRPRHRPGHGEEPQRAARRPGRSRIPAAAAPAPPSASFCRCTMPATSHRSTVRAKYCRPTTLPACASCSSTTPRMRSRRSATCSSMPASPSPAPAAPSRRSSTPGARRFDLLISDVGMPHMDGYQLVEELRNRPKTVSLPAIALTGHGRSEDVQRAFAAGFQAHVDKPVDIAHMKSVIAAVVGAARSGLSARS